jgi:hypothetical protein
MLWTLVDKFLAAEFTQAEASCELPPGHEGAQQKVVQHMPQSDACGFQFQMGLNFRLEILRILTSPLSEKGGSNVDKLRFHDCIFHGPTATILKSFVFQSFRLLFNRLEQSLHNKSSGIFLKGIRLKLALDVPEVRDGCDVAAQDTDILQIRMNESIS